MASDLTDSGRPGKLAGHGNGGRNNRVVHSGRYSGGTGGNFWNWTMSVITQTVFGVCILAAIGTVTVKSVLSPFAPRPLTVHSLTYEAGIVLQDRTIVTDGTSFAMTYTASVVDADTGRTVPWCHGSDSWNYSPGHKVAEIPLAEWVNNPACTPESLPVGTYFLRGGWQWGAEQVAADSAVFEVLE